MPTTWSRSAITLDAALSAVHAAVDAAAVPSAVVVVDPAGAVIASARMDGASAFAAQVAADKAYTSANSTLPTSIWPDAVSADPSTAVRLTSTIDRIAMLPGGLPLHVDGSVVGAIGVSGGSDDQDVKAAQAGADAVGAP